MPTKYANVRERVFSRCLDSEHPKGCWIGIDGGCRFGYQRQDYWIPQLAARVRLTTHILAYILGQVEDTDIGDIYLAYLEFRASGLELDHECEETACRKPAHLVPKTHQENIIAGWERRRARQVTPIVNYEPDPSEIEF